MNKSLANSMSFNKSTIRLTLRWKRHFTDLKYLQITWISFKNYKNPQMKQNSVLLNIWIWQMKSIPNYFYKSPFKFNSLTLIMLNYKQVITQLQLIGELRDISLQLEMQVKIKLDMLLQSQILYQLLMTKLA